MSDYDGFAGRVDIRHLLTWTLAFLAGLVVPGRWSSRVVELRVKARERRNPGLLPSLADKMEEYLGGSPTPDYLRAARAYELRLAELQWGRVRDLSGRRWPIATTVDGAERIHAARAAGTGVILWHMSSGGTGSLPTKMALWREGIPFVHLSRAQHGIGRGSWLAVHLIGPLYLRTEDRYVHERVTIPLDDSLGYMRVLIDRLRNGEVLTIMGEERGRQMVTVPFLGGRRGFATGSAALAHRHHAALLPVFAVRTGPLEYTIIVDHPIAADRSLPRGEYVTAAITEFSRRLGEAIHAHPSDWDGWRKRRDPPASG